MTRAASSIGRIVFGEVTKEAEVEKALFDAVSSGDCVWDVGANVGHYTRLLAERIGPTGQVVAFEPFAVAYRELTARAAGHPQVKCIQVALGASEQDLLVDPVSFSRGFRLIAAAASGEVVHVTTGRKVVLKGYPRPHVLKIDVEGYEEDVLWGMREELSDCRTVLVEVHFSLLEKRGFQRAPGRLISLLQDLGFRVRWLDLGHLLGNRG